MESRLELAARELLALAAAGQELDLGGLRAALESDPTPMIVFGDQDPSWVIQTGMEGTAGLRVVFAKEAVGLLPIGFPGGFSLSYPAAYDLRDLLVEKLESAGTYVALAGDDERRSEVEAAIGIAKILSERKTAPERLCVVCQSEIPDSEEGPECDDTGCPARYGDVEPIDKG